MKNRRVYYTGHELKGSYQLDIDHGNAPNRKDVAKSGTEIFLIRKSVAEKNLKEIGASYAMRIMGESTTAFFFDKTRNVFGFYYEDKVQFVCPIENYIGMRVNKGTDWYINTTKPRSTVILGSSGLAGFGVGSTPTIDRFAATEATLVITYRDGNEIKEFEMKLSVNGRYLATVARTPDELNLLWESALDEVLRSLDKLNLWFVNCQQNIQDILCGTVQVVDLDYKFYSDLNKKFAVEHKKFIEKITKDAKRNNKRVFIRKIILGIIGVAVAIGLIILLGKYYFLPMWGL